MINSKIIATITQIAEKNGQEVFLVGGYIRDMILGIASNDYDFVVSGDALAFSQAVATAIGGRLIIMDQETQTTRIICREAFSQQSAGGKRHEAVNIPNFPFSQPSAFSLQPQPSLIFHP